MAVQLAMPVTEVNCWLLIAVKDGKEGSVGYQATCVMVIGGVGVGELSVETLFLAVDAGEMGEQRQGCRDEGAGPCCECHAGGSGEQDVCRVGGVLDEAVGPVLEKLVIRDNVGVSVEEVAKGDQRPAAEYRCKDRKEARPWDPCVTAIRQRICRNEQPNCNGCADRSRVTHH